MEMTTIICLMKMLKIFFFLIHGLTPTIGKYMSYEFYGYNGIHVNRKGEEGRGESAEDSSSKPAPWEPRQPMPRFDPSLPRNVTSLKDSNAYLHCIVHNLGNRTVSWIREIDLHILTVAQYTYTADERFEVIHRPNTNSWILKINSVQPRDSGRYTCQVNTHPTDPIEFPVYLSVFVPTAHILGSTERYVEKGSTINLTCIVNHNPDPITEIFWYHNNQMISYDSRDSRVSVITDRGEVTKTILLVHDAHDAASGTYSCVPSPNTAATVRIHILNETPAAMQTNRGCRHSLDSLLCSLTLGSNLTASQVSFFLAWLLAFRYISIT